MFLDSKARPVCKADNLTAICKPNCLDNVGSLISQTLYVSTACYEDNFTFVLLRRIRCSHNSSCDYYNFWGYTAV
jgi:hypothetical protein